MLDVKPTGQRGRTASGSVRNGRGISFRHRRLDTSLLSYNDRSIVRDVYTYRVLGICPVPEHFPRKSPPRTSARLTYTGGSCLR